MICIALGIPCILVLLFFLDNIPPKWAGVILLGLASVVVAIITRDLKRCLLFLLVLGIPMNLDVRLIARDESGLINGIFLSICDISIIGLIVIWAVKFKGRNDSGDFRLYFYSQITSPALLFIAVTFLSLFVSRDKTWSLYGIVFHIKLFLVYFVVANCLRTKGELKYILILLGFSLFIQSIAYIYLSYAGVDFDIVGNKLMEFSSDGINRPRGFLGHANSAGTFFAASLILTMSLYFLWRKMWFRIVTIVILLVGIWALILTYSRAGWSSFLLAAIVFVVAGARQGWIRFRIVVLLLFILSLFISVFWDSISPRLTYNLAAKSRIPTMEIAWKIIRGNPALGVGVNAYSEEYHKYVTDELRAEGAMSILHNQYLLVWAETGIIGLFSFIWFLFAIYREGLRTMTCKENDGRILGTGVIMSILAICLSIMTQAGNYGAIPILTWFCAGYIAATRRVVVSNSLQKNTRFEIAGSERM